MNNSEHPGDLTAGGSSPAGETGWIERQTNTPWPRWLERELRSDHAGETGAVQIYLGVLAFARDPAVRSFAKRHLATERDHLERIEALLPQAKYSRLLPLWRLAGFLTGAIPALFGPRAVYATVDVVETFVDHHYGAQIDVLGDVQRYSDLTRILRACRDDEVEHRDEARSLAPGNRGAALRLWSWLVGVGSAFGVAVARRV